MTMMLFHYLQILHTLPKHYWHVKWVVIKGPGLIKIICKVHEMFLTWGCW